MPTNVIIPNANAGIGDVVLMDSSRNIKIVACGTYSSSGLPSGYTAYGVIFGFVNGMARIVAMSEASYRWAMLASDTGNPQETGSGTINCGYPVKDSTIGGDANVMRNGKKTTNVSMNLNSIMQNQYTGGTSPSEGYDPLHPNAAWGLEQVMSKANFDALTAGQDNAKTLYGTWENYLRQTLAIRNPGSCFAAHDADHKVHEQGKWNTFLLGQYTKDNPDTDSQNTGDCWYPAANYCFNYYVSGCGEAAANHNWWLPSMDELLDLMCDAHWSRVKLSTSLNNRAGRWSSLRYSATYAWFFSYRGFSDRGNVRYAWTARPVTLLKIS